MIKRPVPIKQNGKKYELRLAQVKREMGKPVVTASALAELQEASRPRDLSGVKPKLRDKRAAQRG